ncbi:MAG: hypothetical protein L3J43_04840 [Sulfurovum sp.]|nr:hypothetical protein [Sulfurovum sp.]
MNYEEAKTHITEIYPKKLYITKIELSYLLNTSVVTLDRRLKEDSELKRIAVKESKKVLFAIPDVARYLTREESVYSTEDPKHMKPLFSNKDIPYI